MNSKERMIFELYKDKDTICAKLFKSKIKAKDVDAYKIYTYIFNYQIEKYGSPLRISARTPNFEERMKLLDRANKRKYQRRRYCR